jgi:glycine cleavage system H protein
MSRGEILDGNVWFEAEGCEVTFGVTALGVQFLGGVESLTLPSIDDRMDLDDVVFEVEGTKKTLEFLSPFSGSVLKVNFSVADDPMILADDPQDEGWLVCIEAEDETELEELKKQGST